MVCKPLTSRCVTLLPALHLRRAVASSTDQSTVVACMHKVNVCSTFKTVNQPMLPSDASRTRARHNDVTAAAPLDSLSALLIPAGGVFK